MLLRAALLSSLLLCVLCAFGGGGGGVIGERQPEPHVRRVGGATPVADLADPAVLAAAQRAAWAWTTQSSAASSLHKLAFVRSATQQVVAGVKYRLELSVVRTTCGRGHAAAGDAALLHAPGVCEAAAGAQPTALPHAAVVVRTPWLDKEGRGWSVGWEDVEPPSLGTD